MLLMWLLVILEKKSVHTFAQCLRKQKNITIMCDFSQEIFGDVN